MWPLTCGAMPPKLARTVASSVCGRVSHCSSVTITATAAPATISTPSTRPAMRRAPESASSARCAIGLHPEQRHPEDQGDENREARVDERSRTEVGVYAHPQEEPTREHGDADADRGAEHPRGEERADHVDLRSQGPPYRSGAERASEVSPVVNARAAEDSSSWTFVSSSTNRARLNSRRAASRSVSVPRPTRYDLRESSYDCCEASTNAAATSRRRKASLTSVYAFHTSLTARSRVAVISSCAARRADSASSTLRRRAPPSKISHSSDKPMP